MPDPVIQEIKSRIDVVPFVQGYVKLTRAGINWKGLCPFHSEKTPSFIVSPTRQTWHCFGCGKGGDVFKFLMEYENMEFRDALKQLADKAGVELVREDPRLRTERERLYNVSEEAAKFFEAQLKKHPAVMEYLKKRGLKPETITDFRIGYAPDGWGNLAAHLKQKGFTADEFVGSGLGIKSDRRVNSFYDRFRNRIMFPLNDAGGKVIAFSGRIFEYSPIALAKGEAGMSPSAAKAMEGAAKYINSPQTVIFDKSRALYAFDKAKDAIRKKERCVIVEGQMDVVMSHQAGVNEAVAVSGTALTTKHLETLKRLTSTIISSFDTDQAGETATRRSLDLAAEFDFERKVAIIPKGKDPAEAVLEDPKVWVSAVNESTSLMDFYWGRAIKKFNLKTPESKKEFSRFLLAEIAKIANEIEKAHWVSKMAEILGIKEEAVWTELRRHQSVVDARPRGRVESTGPDKQKAQMLEERILGSLFLFPEARAILKEHDSSLIFAISPHGEILKILESGEEGDEVAAMLDKMPEEWRGYVDRIIFEVEQLFNNVGDSRAEILSCVREVERERLKERLTLLAASIDEAEKAGDESKVKDLLMDFKSISETLSRL